MVNAPKRLAMGQRGSRDAYESAAYARKTPPAARLGVKPKKLPVALDRSVEVGNASRTCSLLRLVVRPTCLLGVQVAESGRSSNDGYKRLRRISSVRRCVPIQRPQQTLWDVTMYDVFRQRRLKSATELRTSDLKCVTQGDEVRECNCCGASKPASNQGIPGLMQQRSKPAAKNSVTGRNRRACDSGKLRGAHQPS
jgi:hypothetical protein